MTFVKWGLSRVVVSEMGILLMAKVMVCGSMMWTNRDRIWWGGIDHQALQCEVRGHQRSNKSTPEARKQAMSQYFK
eukprot:scaffold385116_cov86-Attheya_sp.AAC.3